MQLPVFKPKQFSTFSEFRQALRSKKTVSTSNPADPG